MDNILNLKLLAHPLNWGIVWAFCLVMGFAVALISEGWQNRNRAEQGDIFMGAQ